MLKSINMKKLKYFIPIFVLILLFLPLSFVFALEIDYPTLPGGPVVQCAGTSCITIAQYIQYVFIFAFMVVGIIGVVSLVIGGIQYFASSVSPEQKNNAKDRILNTILGIILLMFSFILLNTINPSIVNPRTTVLPIQPGVYLWGYNGGSAPGVINDQHPDGRVYQGAPYLVSDTNTIPAPFTNLYYNCTPPGKNLWVWVYDAKNYEISTTEGVITSFNTKILPCSGSVPNSSNTIGISPIGISPGTGVLSFFWDYESAGVYYYMTTDCTGISTFDTYDSLGQVLTGSRPRFTQQLLGQARSLRIVNDANQQFNYGVILGGSDESGECSLPVIVNGCIGVSDANWPKNLSGSPFNPYYVHIIRQDKNYASRSTQSGISFNSPNYFVTLYQNPDIADMWIDNLESCGDTNTCNLDNLIRAQGRVRHTQNIELIPPAECCTDGLVQNGELACDQVGPDITLDPFIFSYDPARDPPKIYSEFFTEDLQVIPGRFLYNPDYKGYRSCIDTITANDLYTTVVYTKNYLEDDPDPAKRVIDRKCKVYDSNEIRFHRNDLNTLQLFDRGQEIYRTVIIPTVP